MKQTGFILIICFLLQGCSTGYWNQVAQNMQAQQQYQQSYQYGQQQQSQYPSPEQLDLWHRQQIMGTQGQQQLPYPQNEYEMDLWHRQQMYQKRAQERNSCGSFQPMPKPDCKIVGCVNGQWQEVCSEGWNSVHCGIKPLPSIGCRIGQCVNGQWEQVCN